MRIKAVRLPQPISDEDERGQSSIVVDPDGASIAYGGYGGACAYPDKKRGEVATLNFKGPTGLSNFTDREWYLDVLLTREELEALVRSGQEALANLEEESKPPPVLIYARGPRKRLE